MPWTAQVWIGGLAIASVLWVYFWLESRRLDALDRAEERKKPGAP